MTENVYRRTSTSPSSIPEPDGRLPPSREKKSMPGDISPETIITGPRRRFRQLNEKPLRDDLIFYFAIVAVASVFWMAVPILAGLHPTGFILA